MAVMMESDSPEVTGELEPVKLDLEQENPPKSSSSKGSSWLAPLTLDYYQSYFDISTSQVTERILAGMIPVRYRLVESLQPNPDLYGPFWLAVTLILTTAISGNIANIFENREDWEFHFHEVTIIGCCVYTYTWLVPCCLWGILWWRGNRLRYTLFQLLAIYGYAIGIFIPLVILWLIPNEVVRWMLWGVCTLSSGSVLVVALWKPMSQESSKVAIGVLAVAFILHAGLSASFKMYYFSSPLASSHPNLTILHLG